MGVRVGNDLIEYLVRQGHIPDHTVSVDIRLRPYEAASMTVETVDGDQIELMLMAINETEIIAHKKAKR